MVYHFLIKNDDNSEKFLITNAQNKKNIFQYLKSYFVTWGAKEGPAYDELGGNIKDKSLERF